MKEWLASRRVQKQIDELRDFKPPAFEPNVDREAYHEYARKFRIELQKILEVPLFIKQVSVNDPGQSFTFYRARRYQDIKNLNLISEYTYPPVAFCKTIQRANLPYHPVFYASNHALTTVSETIHDNFTKNEVLAISRWRMHDTDPFVIMPILFHGLNPTHPFYSRVEEIKKNGIEEANPGITETQKQNFILVLKALSKEFFNSKDYRVSASLAHSSLYSKGYQECDLILYPSIRTDGASVNFAVHPNFVENRVFMEEIYVIRIGSYCKLTSHIKYRFLYHGKVIGSDIRWLKIDYSNEKQREVIDLFRKRFSTNQY